MLIYEVMIKVMFATAKHQSKKAVGGRMFSLIYLMLTKTDHKDHPCQHLEY